jgi:hypothetical protein
MIKFYSRLDEASFKLETGLNPLEETNTLSDYIKSRREKIYKIKDFRKSQSTKASWRRHRWTHMKSIHKFHRSIEGKRFHRQLADLLANRFTESVTTDRDRFEDMKVITSLKTHMVIEASYYQSSLDESVETELLLDYSKKLLDSLENKVYESKYNFDLDELEFLARIVNVNYLNEKLYEITNNTVDNLVNEDNNESYYYVRTIANSLNLTRLMEALNVHCSTLEDTAE